MVNTCSYRICEGYTVHYYTAPEDILHIYAHVLETSVNLLKFRSIFHCLEPALQHQLIYLPIASTV